MTKPPRFLIDLSGREAAVEINLNVLSEFEEATGIDLAAIAPANLALAHLRKLVWLCVRDSAPGVTEEDVGAALMPYHVAEVLHVLVALLGSGAGLPGTWWTHREAVYAALAKRLPKFVDVSPGACWLANRYAADGRTAVVLGASKDVVLHESVVRVPSLREALAHASESGGFFASVPSVGLDLHELEDALLRGLTAYSVDVPCLAGMAAEYEEIPGTPHRLVRQVK